MQAVEHGVERQASRLSSGPSRCNGLKVWCDHPEMDAVLLVGHFIGIECYNIVTQRKIRK